MGHTALPIGGRSWRWLSRPEQSTFPCVGLDGVAGVQATTQVLSLRPQPHGELAGDMTVTVALAGFGWTRRSRLSRSARTDRRRADPRVTGLSR